MRLAATAGALGALEDRGISRNRVVAVAVAVAVAVNDQVNDHDHVNVDVTSTSTSTLGLQAVFDNCEHQLKTAPLRSPQTPSMLLADLPRLRRCWR